MSLLISSFVLFAFCHFTLGQVSKYPKAAWPWDREYINEYVIRMSAEIIKDIHLKYEHAARYTEMHKSSLNYELGFIAASCYEKFRNMITVYKTYSSLPKFDQTKYWILYTQLEAVEGMYNDILQERRQFYSAVEETELRRLTTQDPNIAALMQLLKAGHSLDPVLLKQFGVTSEVSTEAAKGAKAKGGKAKRRHEEASTTPTSREEATKKFEMGKTQSDYEFKRQMRIDAFEKRRANFDPDLEGIEVDLGDMLKK